MTAREIIGYMESLHDEKQRQGLMRFFKTGPGQYGEGDDFLGLKVPQTREVVKTKTRDLPIDEVPELLMSPWHEVRLCGLLVLVERFGKLATKRLENDENAIRQRDEIVNLYLNMPSRPTIGTWWTCPLQRFWVAGYSCPPDWATNWPSLTI